MISSFPFCLFQSSVWKGIYLGSYSLTCFFFLGGLPTHLPRLERRLAGHRKKSIKQMILQSSKKLSEGRKITTVGFD
jgi:hypothetical protein